MYIKTASGETIELTDSIRWDIEEIQRKEPKSLDITEEETKETVQKFKNNIIDYLKIDVQAFQKEFEQAYRPLIQGNQDIYLCKKYFENLIFIQEKENEIQIKYIHCLDSLKDSIPNNQNYIYNIFLPCKLFLEKEYKDNMKKLNELYDFYDRKSNQLVISSSKMQGEKQYGFSIVKDVLKIEKKYNELRKNVYFHNNPKHLKVTREKIESLYLDKPFDITTDIHGLLDKKRNIIENFADMHLYKSATVNLVKIKKLLDMLNGVAEMINSKYDSVIKNKKFNKKIVYFSNLEQLTIFEICELLEEFNNIKNLIDNEFLKFIRDEKYLKEEFSICDYDYFYVYELLINSDEKIKEPYTVGTDEEENIRIYLQKIFK